MAEKAFLSDDSLVEFLRLVPADELFVNVREDDTASWERLEDADPASVSAGLRAERPFYSFKSVLMPAAEVVARYGEAEGDPLEETADRRIAVAGVRGCECRVLDYLDAIMLDEPTEDPFYQLRRRNTIIVGVDCVEAADSCFCDLFGEHAYPETNFDLNLSPVEGGFLVEAGSETGEEVLGEAGSILSEATERHREQLQEMRDRTAAQLEEQNADYKFPDDFAESMPETIEELFWRVQLAECVQCGGCTAVCPACYCFLLYDQEKGENQYERVRAWDSCQFTGYSEMAGPPGTTPPDPRRRHMTKFQHRFAHKFWYNSLSPGILGCVGCGRCRDTCPGAIDLREVLTDMRKERVSNG